MTEINKKISVGNTNISVDTEKMNKTESTNLLEKNIPNETESTKLLDNNLNKTESNNLLLDNNTQNELDNNNTQSETVNNNPKKKEKKNPNQKKKLEQKSSIDTPIYFDTYFENSRTLAATKINVQPILLSPRSKIRKELLYKNFFNKFIFLDIQQSHLHEHVYQTISEEKDLVRYQTLVLQYFSNPNNKVSKKKILDPLNDHISEDTLDPTAVLGYYLNDNQGKRKFYQFKFRIESIRPFNGKFQCIVSLRKDQIPHAEKVQLNNFINNFVLFYEQNITQHHYRTEHSELRLNIGQNTALKLKNLVFLPTTEVKAPKYFRF